MQSIQLSGLFLQPIALRIAGWVEAGKLLEEDLDRALTPNARSLVETTSRFRDWVPLEDAESLVYLASEQLGGSEDLAAAAGAVVASWVDDEEVVSVRDEARGLVDGAGYVVSQMSRRFVLGADWQYEGGRDRFAVRLLGLDSMSASLRTLLGATLSRLAEGSESRFGDVRFEGVDAGDLVVFGECASATGNDASGEDRLLRAALAG